MLVIDESGVNSRTWRVVNAEVIKVRIAAEQVTLKGKRTNYASRKINKLQEKSPFSRQSWFSVRICRLWRCRDGAPAAAFQPTKAPRKNLPYLGNNYLENIFQNRECEQHRAAIVLSVLSELLGLVLKIWEPFTLQRESEDHSVLCFSDFLWSCCWKDL